MVSSSRQAERQPAAQHGNQERKSSAGLGQYTRTRSRPSYRPMTFPVLSVHYAGEHYSPCQLVDLVVRGSPKGLISQCEMTARYIGLASTSCTNDRRVATYAKTYTVQSSNSARAMFRFVLEQTSREGKGKCAGARPTHIEICFCEIPLVPTRLLGGNNSHPAALLSAEGKRRMLITTVSSTSNSLPFFYDRQA